MQQRRLPSVRAAHHRRHHRQRRRRPERGARHRRRPRPPGAQERGLPARRRQLRLAHQVGAGRLVGDGVHRAAGAWNWAAGRESSSANSTGRASAPCASRSCRTSLAARLKMSLGIYIQVPFCQTKCTYCNFHTGPAARGLYAPYANAVVREISDHESLYRCGGLAATSRRCPPRRSWTRSTSAAGRRACSIRRIWQRIVDAVRGSFAHKLSEVTLEADPETITAEKAAGVASGGHRSHQPGRAVVSRCRAGRRRTHASPCGYFQRVRVPARGGICKHQHGFDRRAAAPDGGELAGFAERAVAASVRSTCPSTCWKWTRAAAWAGKFLPAAPLRLERRAG